MARRSALALILATVVAGPARARLSTGMIRSELAAMGFKCIGKVRLRGFVYEVPACLPNGRKVIVRVDPDTAKVLRIIKVK